ncbi:MAG: HD-GYP domain-containing protein [Actinomycetota bacterium]|nr:HD-GYP domain-containing protein [Actinomycetota bacterium]
MRAGDLGHVPDDDVATFDPLPDGAAIIPLESGEGRLHGSLVCRPVGPDRELDERDLGFLRVLGRVVGAQIERSERDRHRVREQAEASGLQALLAAIEARDAYTGEHSRSVVDLSVRVAEELRLASREIEQIQQVALLHDVGKVAIPDNVLQKRGPLTASEFDLVRTHPVVGARIVSSVSDLAHLAPAIRSGHERWDGMGYPDGLSGDEIPVPSRITFVCDAYDAMISERPYRPPLSPKEAHSEVRRNVGSQFCPRAATALLGVLQRHRPPVRSDTWRPTAPPV